MADDTKPTSPKNSASPNQASVDVLKNEPAPTTDDLMSSFFQKAPTEPQLAEASPSTDQLAQNLFSQAQVTQTPQQWAQLTTLESIKPIQDTPNTQDILLSLSSILKALKSNGELWDQQQVLIPHKNGSRILTTSSQNRSGNPQVDEQTAYYSDVLAALAQILSWLNKQKDLEGFVSRAGYPQLSGDIEGFIADVIADHDADPNGFAERALEKDPEVLIELAALGWAGFMQLIVQGGVTDIPAEQLEKVSQEVEQVHANVDDIAEGLFLGVKKQGVEEPAVGGESAEAQQVDKDKVDDTTDDDDDDEPEKDQAQQPIPAQKPEEPQEGPLTFGDFFAKNSRAIQFGTAALHARMEYELFGQYGITPGMIENNPELKALSEQLRISCFQAVLDGFDPGELRKMMGSAPLLHKKIEAVKTLINANPALLDQLTKAYGEAINSIPGLDDQKKQELIHKITNTQLINTSAGKQLAFAVKLSNPSQGLHNSITAVVGTGVDATNLEIQAKDRVDALILSFGIDLGSLGLSAQQLASMGIDPSTLSDTANSTDALWTLRSMSDADLVSLLNLGNKKLSPAQLDSLRASMLEYATLRGTMLAARTQGKKFATGLWGADPEEQRLLHSAHATDQKERSAAITHRVSVAQGATQMFQVVRENTSDPNIDAAEDVITAFHSSKNDLAAQLSFAKDIAALTDEALQMQRVMLINEAISAQNLFALTQVAQIEAALAQREQVVATAAAQEVEQGQVAAPQSATAGGIPDDISPVEAIQNYTQNALKGVASDKIRQVKNKVMDETLKKIRNQLATKGGLHGMAAAAAIELARNKNARIAAAAGAVGGGIALGSAIYKALTNVGSGIGATVGGIAGGTIGFAIGGPVGAAVGAGIGITVGSYAGGAIAGGSGSSVAFGGSALSGTGAVPLTPAQGSVGAPAVSAGGGASGSFAPAATQTSLPASSSLAAQPILQPAASGAGAGTTAAASTFLPFTLFEMIPGAAIITMVMLSMHILMTIYAAFLIPTPFDNYGLTRRGQIREGIAGCWPVSGLVYSSANYQGGGPHKVWGTFVTTYQGQSKTYPGPGTALDINGNDRETVYTPFSGEAGFYPQHYTGAGTAYAEGEDSEGRHVKGMYGNRVILRTEEYAIIFAHLNDFYDENGNSIAPMDAAEAAAMGVEFPIKDMKIEAGMAIGSVGSTGNSSGPHLHYESIGTNIMNLLPLTDSERAFFIDSPNEIINRTVNIDECILNSTITPPINPEIPAL